MSLINPYTEPIYLYSTSSVIYFCGLVIAYPSHLYVRRSINVLGSVFVFSFAISLVNGLLLQRWLNRNSHISLSLSSLSEPRSESSLAEAAIKVS